MNLKGIFQLIKIIPYLLIIFFLSSCINGTQPDFDENFVIKFSVYYDPNGADEGYAPIDNTDYISGDIVTVPGNPHGLKRENYSFTGWNLYPDGTYINFTQGDALEIPDFNIVFFARWTQNDTFSITYEGNGADTGTVPIYTTMYEEGMHPIVAGNSGNLVKSGYSFVGWNTNADGSGITYTHGSEFEMGNANVTLYAVWTKRPTYVITYVHNGSETGTVPIDNNRYEEGQTATVLLNTGNLRKAEFGFAGWNTQADGKGDDYKPGGTITVGDENIRLYAKWEKAYSVTYHRNEAESGNAPIDSAYYLKGATVTVAGNAYNLRREYYNFAGWNTKADGSGISYTAGATFIMGEADVILYAEWAAKPLYSVIYNDNGATGGLPPVDSSAYLEGASVAAMGNPGALVKTGYVFLGWNTQADGFGLTYTPGETFAMGNANFTLYAKWGGPGMLDISFNLGGAGAADGDVYSIAVQIDDKIIIAGSFTKYNGTVRNKIARLNSDGSLDTSFNPGNSIATDKVLDEDEELMISAVAVQNDGKIIIVGNFTSYNGTARNRIARLNSDGSLDFSFDPGTGAAGTDDVISCVAIQPDGKIIAGGSFSSFNNEPVNNIVRLTNTGSLDINFGADFDEEDDSVAYNFPNDAVSSIAIQSDGKIIIGGAFTQCGLHPRAKLARYNSDGTFDAAFNPGLGAVDEIYSVVVQPDDKILAGGSGGWLRRFNSDGSSDMGFIYGGADDDIYGIAVQSDGKILLCGIFESFNTVPCKYLIRLNSNGAVDTDFKTIDGPDNTITCVAVHNGGNILIGGAFTMYGNTGKAGIVRILK